MERPAGEERPCIWVSDERRQTSFYGYDISRSDVTDWLSADFGHRFAANTEVATQASRKGMHIMVTRAYVNPHAQVLTGVVVLRVVWGANDQIYRGQETRTNWWGTDNELQRDMSNALDKALGQITLPMALSTCVVKTDEAAF